MAHVRYEPIAWSEVPGWAEDDHAAALEAFRASCPRVLSKPAKAAPPRPDDRRPTAASLAAACKAATELGSKPSRGAARQLFERHFQPHRVAHSGFEGLATGYYEATLEGSRTRQGRFQTPLLRRPPDLVTVVPETRAAAPGQSTHARQSAAGLVPFATRAEIESGALAGRGLELLWVTDPVEKFFLQIQGSGLVRLPDGSSVRVQYDGKNGHPYTSIGRYLIDRGLVAADKMTMGALGRWLKSDMARAQEVMNQNASYVFFKELPAGAGGPLGAIEVPLVAGRSVAVDPAVHRLGSPIWVSAPTLTHHGQAQGFQRLMVAHDVGAAIKGPERADIYFGSGEAAERVAGMTRHPVNLIVLVANPAPPAPAAAVAAGGSGPQRP